MPPNLEVSLIANRMGSAHVLIRSHKFDFCVYTVGYAIPFSIEQNRHGVLFLINCESRYCRVQNQPYILDGFLIDSFLLCCFWTCVPQCESSLVQIRFLKK